MSDQLTAPIYILKDDVEELEQYREGGYHPVYIDDVLHSRYCIVHKLGYGSYSTVWLVRDQQRNRYASLKIVTANKSKDKTESQILHHLDLERKGGWFSSPLKFWRGSHLGKKFVLEVLDEFEIQGPNGNHRCIVSEPLGPSLSCVLEDMDDWRLPLYISRKVAVQLTQGLSYLHACGIVHGDLHEGNILFRIPGMDLWTDEQVYSYLGEPDLVEITRRDGQPPTPRAPEYAVKPPDPEMLLQLFLTNDCAIQIVDFGEAFFSTGQSVAKCLHTPVWFAAPEVMFLDLVSPSSDIWALACLMYKILGGRLLFKSFDGDRNEVLRAMVRTFGKFPDRWWYKWEKRSDYFPEDGMSASAGGMGMKVTDLKARFQDLCKLLGPEEVTAFEKMLRVMLRFEPEERISIKEVVRLLPSSWGQGDLV